MAAKRQMPIAIEAATPRMIVTWRHACRTAAPGSAPVVTTPASGCLMLMGRVIEASRPKKAL